MAKRAKGQSSNGADRRDTLVAQRAVNEAGGLARQATRLFYNALDAHMKGEVSERVVVDRAKAMWRANGELRRLESKHGLTAKKTPPSSKPHESGKPQKSNLFGVRSIVAGSFESGKRR
jgi:hypothetical protein